VNRDAPDLKMTSKLNRYNLEMVLDNAQTTLTEVHLHDCMPQLLATKFSGQNLVGRQCMNTKWFLCSKLGMKDLVSYL